MTMARPVFVVVVVFAVLDAAIGKHIFNSKPKTWSDAQAHCKSQHVDLSFASSQSDQDQILKASGETVVGWIGLELDTINKVWNWSGGGVVTYTNWGTYQPDNWEGKERKGMIWYDRMWHDGIEDHPHPFYCFHIEIEPVKMTWEGALEYCQDANISLINLTSETDHAIIQRVVDKHQSDRVWMGLRYLGDRWLWVNGEALEYQAWLGQDHQCPGLMRCGALGRDGVWETRQCQEENYFICQ